MGTSSGRLEPETTVLHCNAMRFAGSRCRFPAVVAVVLATAIGVSAAMVVVMAGLAPAALAAPAPLTVSVDRSLSLVGDPLSLTISGQLPQSLKGAKLVVRVTGPADLGQVGEPAPELREANKIVLVLGTTSGTTGAGGTVTGATAGTAAGGLGGATNDADLEAGRLATKVMLPAGTFAKPGAYLLAVEVKSAGNVWASGQAWMGKAATRDTPLDVAFVWPLCLGIHRDADGVFYDSVLEQEVSSSGSASGDLLGALSLSQRFLGWNFTLAVEPVLLTQLRDMADGYVRRDASGNEMEVNEDDPEALDTGAVLATFESLAGDDSVEVAVSPYAGADLGLLGAEGWRDGFEQIQMGKQELQQTLGLEAPLTGAYSPSLDLTSDSLAFYAQASVDHVVVTSGLAGLLTEPVGEGTVAVRARNVENDRVTLVFADSALSALIAAPWDVGTLFAALAAELAWNPRDAIVIAPATEFVIPPQSYLDSIGQTLEGLGWLRTQTLAALIRSHSPDTRPVMLKTGTTTARGYIQETVLAGLRTAHAAVTNLAAVADATRAPVEAAHRLLYMAESRWWSRAGTSPQEATFGLQYAERAQALAQGELDKVRFLGAKPNAIIGREGVVSLTMENAADYPITAELDLSATGLTLPAGQQVEVELAPGRTEVPVKVVRADGPHELAARLVAGTSTLDELDRSLRFVTLATVLPGAVAGALAIGVGAFFLTRWYLRKRHATRSA